MSAFLLLSSTAWNISAGILDSDHKVIRLRDHLRLPSFVSLLLEDKTVDSFI